jgi:5-methylcytosine-specific restriction enzyme B
VVHYAKGSIRAIGIVLEKGVVHRRPSELPTESWNPDGYLAKIEYHDLGKPIALAELPPRSPDAGPLDRDGEVKQGYLFSLSAEFVASLYDRFRDRWPIEWLSRTDARSVWLFQANPNAMGH